LTITEQVRDKIKNELTLEFNREKGKNMEEFERFVKANIERENKAKV